MYSLALEQEKKLNIEQLQINHYDQGIEIIVPPKRSVFVSSFLGLWMLAWTYGEIFIIGRLVHGSGQVADGFMITGMFAWSIAGFIAVLIWLWNTKGREIILISESEVRRYREYVLFSRSEMYECCNIRNLRVNEIDLSCPDMVQGAEFWGLSGGMIAFDYGEQTGKFGLGIADEDAYQIIEAINSRYQWY